MDLEKYLKDQGIAYRLINKAETIHTVDAAKSTGIPLKMITKSLIFIVDTQPIAVVIPGTCKVNVEKLRSALKAQTVHLASFKDAEKYSGYPPGGTPPLHYRDVRKIIVDKKVINYNVTYGGGGSRDILLELKTVDLLQLSGGLVMDIADESMT